MGWDTSLLKMQLFSLTGCGGGGDGFLSSGLGACSAAASGLGFSGAGGSFPPRLQKQTRCH